MMNFFEVCQKVLTTGRGGEVAADGGQPGIPPDAVGGATAFLIELGYMRRAGADAAPVPACAAPKVLEQRCALLGLAGRLERVFRLPCRQAPTAFFVGGEIAPGRFGLTPPDNPVEGVGGKGLTLAAAFEGCLGEAAEYLSFLRWGDEPVFRSSADSLFCGALGDRSADLAWMLAGIGRAGSAVDQALDWVEAQPLGAGRPLPVPAALCYRAPPGAAEGSLRKAESNGCAAAPGLRAAQCGALLEVVERDAVALWWYGGRDPGPLAVAPPDGEALDGFMAALRKGAERRHWFLDLTTDVGIPVIAALSADVTGGSVIAGFAAGLDPLAAARRAALEMCQMELGLDLVLLKIEQRGRDALNDADRKHLDRMARMRTDAFSRLRPRASGIVPPRASHADPDRDLELCLERLSAAGFEAYWIDLSRPALNVPVARVLVPGLQSGRPDWLTPRLRRTAGQHDMPPSAWHDLPSVI